MKFKNVFLFIIFSSFFYSCSSKKNIIYLQDIKTNTNYSIDYEEYIIKPDDILKIEVNSEVPEAALVVNPNAITNYNNNRESFLLNGYQVNSKGYINFPKIGKIQASGYSIREFRDSIEFKIKEEKLILKDPYIDVKLLNAHFTIIGEVHKPGKYDFLENNINILEAIGMAGDLTINGKRNDIKIIREVNSEKKITNIDLTSSNFISNKDKYQIFSGDIIIVNPNTSRIKNAGIIGNSGTLLSLLSFILSSIIVISRS